MNENLKKRNEVLADTVIKGLKSRNMTGYYAKIRKKRLRLLLSLSLKTVRLQWADV